MLFYDHILYISIHSGGHQIQADYLGTHYNDHNTNQCLEIFLP